MEEKKISRVTLADGTEVSVKKYIGIIDFSVIVNRIADECVDEKSGEYTPELVAALTDSYIVGYYTDYQMPAELDQQYDMIRSLNIIESIIDKIDQRQLNELSEAIDRSIQYKLNLVTSTAAKQIAETEDWMNNYPRKIFGYRSSNELFKDCLAELGLAQVAL